MPGILPMKVIRVGNSTQSRIAQACDRCRSKKIRCDGIRPCCTQCANVGFECKTSDKLSRRAFPRGYTESLEDRVRGLEAEVRELKDLLDEKDEKIDMLSRIHNFSPSRKCSTSLSPASSAHIKADLESAREDILHVETAVPAEPTAPSLGTSSTAAFITSFDNKVQESGRQVPNIRPSALTLQPHFSPSPAPQRNTSKTPPRLLSDQHINLFFQEWQPLLPILHRPSFLRVYEQFVIDPEASHWHSNKQAVAQLYLIFDIATLSSISRSKPPGMSYECQWRKALHATSSNASVSTLQCHLLAELYYLLKADYTRLARHRAIAVSVCHQLGLHQSQNYLSLSVFEAETRKKVFWSQYVLDKFTSAATGTPMLFQEADITTEYPADVDDENLNSQGFSPALPGELTKISSALALFKASRILSKTLAHLYPAKASYELSLIRLHALSDELDQWSTNLPSHLRLQFCKDKPSTNVISCRSPLLFLAYFYTRSLIHRPLVCHGSGNSASASTIALAAAAKHVVQILDLLDERRMNYTFPLNKSELLLTSGFSLLWQCLDLEQDSKLVKDNQKSITMLVDILGRESQIAATEFLGIASCFVSTGITGRRPQASSQSPKRPDSGHNSSLRNSNNLMLAPSEKHKSTRKQLQAIASRFSTFGNKQKPEEQTTRRATVPREMPNNPMDSHHRTFSTLSLTSTRSAPVVPLCLLSPNLLTHSHTIDAPPNVNLDYFPIGEETETHSSSTTTVQNKNVPNDSWEQLLTNIDYSDIYGTHPSNNPSESPEGVHQAASTMSSSQEWATPGPDDTWPNLSAISLSASNKGPVPQSVLSFSEESLVSHDDDLVFSAAGSNNGSTVTNDSVDLGSGDSNNKSKTAFSGFKGIAMPTVDDDFEFHDLDGKL